MKSLTIKVVLMSVVIAGASNVAMAQTANDTAPACKYQELMKLIKKNNAKKLEKFFIENPSTTATCMNHGDAYPLIRAGLDGRHKVVPLLISSGADVNYRNIYGLTPVLATSAGGNDKRSLAIMKELRKTGADFHAVDNSGMNAALYSAYNLNNWTAKYLDEQGVDFKKADARGSTVMNAFVSSVQRRGFSTADIATWDLVAIIRKYGVKSGTPYQARDIKDSEVRNYQQEQEALQQQRNQPITAECATLSDEYKTVLKSAGNEHIRDPRQKMRADARVSLGIIYKVEKSSCQALKMKLADQGFNEGMIHSVLRKNNVPIPTKSEITQPKRTTIPPTNLPCPTTTYENLTPEQGIAMKHAVALDLKQEGVDFGKQCIQKITAKTKVPFRGNTLISYRVDLFYPNGYNAHCLKLDKNAASNLSKKWNWDTYEQITAGGCNAFSGAISGKPIEVGGSRYFEGDTEI